MRKYIIPLVNTINEILTYRLNFTMWRLRNLSQLLTTYFLWFSVMPDKGTLFGYSKEQMLAYILATVIVGAFVFSTRTAEIAENINSGDLSTFILRPIGYFRYWFFRDLGDKAMNLVFSTGELLIFIILFSPPIFLQGSLYFLLFSILSLGMAVVLHFYIGSLLGLVGFWSPEVWAPRFIFYVLVSLLTGAIFPLDVFPASVKNILDLTPFPYLLFFPIKIYLGQLGINEILNGVTICLIWILIMYLLLIFVWKKGIKGYSAVGR